MAIGDDTAPKWYPWHWFEFDKATRGWPLIARAVYRELLDFQWADGGSVPADPERLRMLVGASEADWPTAAKLVLPLFPKTGERRSNPKLELVRRQQDERMRAYSDAGRRGAESRWGNARDSRVLPSDANGNPIATSKRFMADRDSDSDSDSEGDRNSDTPTSPESQRLANRAQAREALSVIRSRYPKSARQDWIHAEHHMQRIIEQGKATAQQLVEGVDRYAAFIDATGQSAIKPSRFFSEADDPWAQAWQIPTKKNGKRSRFEEVSDESERLMQEQLRRSQQ